VKIHLSQVDLIFLPEEDYRLEVRLGPFTHRYECDEMCERDEKERE